MAQKTANQLKQYFLTGSFPTQQQFYDLIESLFNNEDDTLDIEKVNGLYDALLGKASVEQLSNKADLNGSVDIEITDSAAGIILQSPDGNRWRVQVSDTGALTTTTL